MLEFHIINQTLRCSSPVIAADSYNFLAAKFYFADSTWDDASVWAHFRQGETVYDKMVDENSEIPPDAGLNLTVGEWEVYITGTRGESRLTSTAIIITVKESGLIDAPLHAMPLSVAEQIDSKASNALSVAQAVKAAADRGDFDGRDGHGITVLGYVESVAELLVVDPTPQPGDAYGVGTEEPYNIYIYDALHSEWKDNGAVTGIEGERGERGAVFTPHISLSGVLTFTNDAGLPNPDPVSVIGPRGLQGLPGEDGKSPYQIAVESGYTGTEATFNAALRDIAYHHARHEAGGADPITVSTGMVEDGGITQGKLAAGIMPFKTSITLDTSWSGADPYTHAVSLSGYTLTANSKVDLQPSAAVIQQLIDDGVSALYIDNNNGTLTAYSIGAKPTASLTIQVTVREVKT